MPVKGKKIGFLGGGNMGEALIRGLVKTGLIPPEDLFVTDVRRERLEELARLYGLHTLSDNALLVPYDVITLPSPHHSPGMVRTLEAEVAALAERLGTPSMTAEVRARLRDGRRCRTCDIATIASELHVSVRTLQRRLGEEGTRFSDVLDMARRDVALELLAEGATLERTARAVGLSGGRVAGMAVSYRASALALLEAVRRRADPPAGSQPPAVSIAWVAQSQFGNRGLPIDIYRDIARMNGRIVGVQYAEGLDVGRLLLA